MCANFTQIYTPEAVPVLVGRKGPLRGRNVHRLAPGEQCGASSSVMRPE